MTIPYVQKEYYWIPRIYGQDPETGTYAVLPAGGWQWISDQNPTTIPFNPAPGLSQRALHLPAALPRQVYLSGVEVAVNIAAPNSNVSDFGGWVDPAGHFFHSGLGHNGAEEGSNFTDSISLFHVIFTGPGRWFRDFPHPILVDRDAGDLICVKTGLAVGGVNVFVGFRYMVPT